MFPNRLTFYFKYRISGDTSDKTGDVGGENLFSHFFIASTLNLLGDKSSFDNLIQRNDLNNLVKLGMKHVIDDSGITNNNIDKCIKNFGKKLKDSPLTNKYIEDLYEKSLTEINKNGLFISD